MTEQDAPGPTERGTLPQKKAGRTVSRVVDPNAWQHADEDHPGTAEPVAGTAEPVAGSDAPGDD